MSARPAASRDFRDYGRVAVVVAGGLGFFVAAVALALGMAFFNARVTPGIPWFALVVLPLLAVVVVRIDRRWDIGLSAPVRRTGTVAVFAVSSMIASHSVLVLEGAAHGLVREFEPPPDGVTPLFAAVYWAAVVLAMSTASEVAFRGIMQSRLAISTGPVAALLLPLLVNLVSHRWDGLYERALGVTCILLAWGCLRQLSGSLRATILTHVGAIAAWDAILWTLGPWDHGAMDARDLALTAAIGGVALLVAVRSARSLARLGGVPDRAALA